MTTLVYESMLHAALFSLFVHAVHGGLPVSYPGVGNEDFGDGSVPYNMIDTNPSCYERGICPMFPPGGRLSAFPNSEEKVQHIIHNLFRMWGNYSLDIKYGKWKWAVTDKGGRTHYCTSCRYCGDTRIDMVPLYWYSDANQAARFKQYDENACDQDWYDQSGITAHHTCDWVLSEFGGGSHCNLFDGSCTMESRSHSFCTEDNCWFETEGICAANTCVTDGHCEPIFAAKYDYQGTGFVEGMNGAATVYSRSTDTISYVLPSGAHFDERLKLVEDERHPNGKYLTLMLQYFDTNRTQKPVQCWSLYDETYHEMEVVASDVGDVSNGFSKDSYSVMFTTNHLPPTQCEPYAFICKTTENNFFRLPEDTSYYFGTEWIDWEWSDYASFGDGYLCKENHYYHDEGKSLWIVNGGPTLSTQDIWYYQDTDNYGRCIGCSKIEKLDCVTLCILSDFGECGDCHGTTPTELTESYISNGGVVAWILMCLLVFTYVYHLKRSGKSICGETIGDDKSSAKPKTIPFKDGNCKSNTADKTNEIPSDVAGGTDSIVSSIIASLNNNKKNIDSKGNDKEREQLCKECEQHKKYNDGKIDDNDGLWYCTKCWTQFME
eukprot:251031_1